MAEAGAGRPEQDIVAEPAVLVVELHAHQGVEIPVKANRQFGGVVRVLGRIGEAQGTGEEHLAA